MTRRAIMCLVAMGATLVLSSGLALAINAIQCKEWTDCQGTKAADLMKGSAGSDRMYGKGRSDTLRGFGNTTDTEEELHGQGGSLWRSRQRCTCRRRQRKPLRRCVPVRS